MGLFVQAFSCRQLQAALAQCLQWQLSRSTVTSVPPSLLYLLRRLGSGDALVGQLVTRNAERDTPKRLYMVGPAVEQLLSADEQEALKVTSVGVKAFERQESKVNTAVEQFQHMGRGRTHMLLGPSQGLHSALQWRRYLCASSSL